MSGPFEFHSMFFRAVVPIKYAPDNTYDNKLWYWARAWRVALIIIAHRNIERKVLFTYECRSSSLAGHLRYRDLLWHPYRVIYSLKHLHWATKRRVKETYRNSKITPVEFIIRLLRSVINETLGLGISPHSTVIIRWIYGYRTIDRSILSRRMNDQEQYLVLMVSGTGIRSPTHFGTVRE